MHSPKLIYLLLGSALTYADDSCSPRSRDLTVRTSSGAFTGFVNDSTPDVNQWLGIPYGVPPVNNRRFLPPEPAPYSGARDADSYQPICIQDSDVHSGVFWQLVTSFQNQDQQSEDCLYLNIWGPRNPVEQKSKAPTQKVPVIIWGQ
jgi:carboxylesterase type B